MISTSLQPAFAPKNQETKRTAKPTQAPQPAFTGHPPDSFHHTKSAVRFGADEQPDLSILEPAVWKANLANAVEADMIGSLELRNRHQSWSLENLRDFQTQNDNAKAYAEMWPEQYTKNISYIVTQTHTYGTNAGEAAFNQFRDATAANTLDNRVAKALYRLGNASPDLRALKGEVKSFHKSDEKIKTYAELHPEKYIKQIESIVTTAQNRSAAEGKAEFQQFKQQTDENITPLDIHVVKALYPLGNASRDLRALKGEVKSFHKSDEKIKAYAELHPKEYVKKIESIVKTAQDESAAAGRAKFQQFVHQTYEKITPLYIRIANLLHEFQGGRPGQQKLKDDLRIFHAEDKRASDYANREPGDYAETMRDIVDTTQVHGVVAGRTAFEDFLDYITSETAIPPRNTASSSSLLNQPRSHQREQRGNSPTRRGEYIRGGDGRLYKKEREEGNRTEKGVYSGPHPG
jgi:hypothetical protein